MRVLIYPFNEDFEPFIKYGMFMENMEITESLSPRGWGLQDKIIAKKIANKHDIKEVQWNNIDALLLIDSEVIVLTDQEIIEVILISAQNGKKIIVNRNLNENMFLNISDICKKENVELIDKRVKVQGEELFDRRLQRIETPVVFVSGMGEKYKNAKNLIWSVLGNTGGDSRFPEKFASALSGYANWEMTYAELFSPLAGDNRESAHEKSYEIHSLPENNPDSSKFGGKLWLLQNKEVASSGESAVMYARSVKNSVSVGSATCGCGQFGDILGYHLPNSNILFCMGYKVFNMDGFEEGKGLAPDYWLDSDDPVTALAEYINEENGK